MDGEKSGGAGSPVESNAVQAEKAGTYSAHMPASGGSGGSAAGPPAETKGGGEGVPTDDVRA